MTATLRRVTWGVVLTALSSCEPKTWPHYPCCANGEMADCHGDPDRAEAFEMCGAGRCVTGGGKCSPPPPDAPDAGPETPAPSAPAEP